MPITTPIANLNIAGSTSAISSYTASTPELDLLAAQDKINHGEHLSDQEIQALLDKLL
jgi:hypothetical protein